MLPAGAGERSPLTCALQVRTSGAAARPCLLLLRVRAFSCFLITSHVFARLRMPCHALAEPRRPAHSFLSYQVLQQGAATLSKSLGVTLIDEPIVKLVLAARVASDDGPRSNPAARPPPVVQPASSTLESYGSQPGPEPEPEPQGNQDASLLHSAQSAKRRSLA